MNKKIFLAILFCLLNLVYLFPQAVDQKVSNLVAAELTAFEQSECVKNRLDMKDPFLRHIINVADKGICAAKEKSLLKRWLSNFFLNGFPGLELECASVNGLFLVTEQQFPQLFKKVCKLTKRLNISSPWIFINFDKDFFNAYACSFSSSLSMVVLGRDLAVKLSDNELEGVLAHELAHIKHNHVPKALIGLAITLYVLIDLLVSGIDFWRVLLGERSSGNVDLTLASKCLMKILLKSVFFLLCGIIIAGFSRFFEEEADKTAIEIVDNKQEMVDLFNTFYQETSKKYEEYKKEYQMVLEKLVELDQYAPWLKKILHFWVRNHNVMRCDDFEGMLDGDGDIHPSWKSRINKANAAIVAVPLQVLVG